MHRLLVGFVALATITASFSSLSPTAVGAEGECPPASPPSKRASWPAPPKGNDFDVVHFGEGHWNEGQGPKTMPILVQDVAAFDPEFVLFSSDMADTGTPDRLGCFRMLMEPLVRAGIPWYDSPGNHDRVPIAGAGGLVNGSIEVWRDVFSQMPAPWGDGPLPDRRFRAPKDADGKGASTHYYFDFGPSAKPILRVIVLDNSMHSLTTSDSDQYPAVGGEDAGQLAFLQRVASEASEKGLMTWVVMHQPTQDPRDISNAHPISYNHTMGKGASPDNVLFDVLADQTGVDAVLLGHIQGNAVYSFGQVDYFIDGGGGGSPYALQDVGADTGYLYGFRVLRAHPGKNGWSFRTYMVPLVDQLRIKAPTAVKIGDELQLDATAIQPFDPDLPPRAGLLPNEPITLELEPASEDADPAAPQLAYMWQTSDPSILRPLPSTIDPKADAAFDSQTMTMSGRFAAVRSGTARISIMVGTQRRTVTVTVR